MWFHEDLLLLQPASELEFDLELLGRNSRAPKFSPWGFGFAQPGAHLCFLGGGYTDGYEGVK